MQDQPIDIGPYSKKVVWMYFNRIGNCQNMLKESLLDKQDDEI